MKAILMSIKPQHVANILNGLKTIEVRKRFSKDYVGWVYIYVTKGKPYLSSNSLGYYIPKKYEKYMGNHNGKVVARFWCDKVEEIETKLTALGYAPYTKTLSMPGLLKNSCLTIKDLNDYLQGNCGYAIHVAKLEIFYEPKEISEFKQMRADSCGIYYKPLTRAPQSWQYIEVDL